MKTYVLTVSRTFSATHHRKGEPTFFVEKIHQGVMGKLIPCELCDRSSVCNKKHCVIDSMNFQDKIHTIRANYPLWKKRFEEIEAGRACLSLRYWSGKPYRSKQVEIARLTNTDGIGIQELEFEEMIMTGSPVLVTGKKGFEKIFKLKKNISLNDLAKNDGLSFDDFKEWFKDYDLSEPLAIIHFTKFRY